MTLNLSLLKKGKYYTSGSGRKYECTTVRKNAMLSMSCTKYLPNGMPAYSPDAIWTSKKTAAKQSQPEKPYGCPGRMELNPVTGKETIKVAHECMIYRHNSISNVLIDNIPAPNSMVHYNGISYLTTSNKDGVTKCRCRAYLSDGVLPHASNAKWYSSAVNAKKHQHDQSRWV